MGNILNHCPENSTISLHIQNCTVLPLVILCFAHFPVILACPLPVFEMYDIVDALWTPCKQFPVILFNECWVTFWVNRFRGFFSLCLLRASECYSLGHDLSPTSTTVFNPTSHTNEDIWQIWLYLSIILYVFTIRPYTQLVHVLHLPWLLL